jgi:hypothetical protein
MPAYDCDLFHAIQCGGQGPTPEALAGTLGSVGATANKLMEAKRYAIKDAGEPQESRTIIAESRIKPQSAGLLVN